MRQYQVPQFINIEDRIIGPLTFRQFLYILGGAAVLVIGWTFLQFFLFLILAVPVATFFAALAFVKVSGRPLSTVVFSAFNYFLKPKRYLWKQTEIKPKSLKALREPVTASRPPLTASLPKLSENKLSDLAWSLDIKEKIEGR